MSLMSLASIIRAGFITSLYDFTRPALDRKLMLDNSSDLQSPGLPLPVILIYFFLLPFSQTRAFLFITLFMG
jgi:hypothetical protein